MNFPKTLLPLVALGIFLLGKPLCAETLFGAGTISIGTNETILLTTFDGPIGLSQLAFFLDGNNVSTDENGAGNNLPIAVTGPHSLYVTNGFGYDQRFSHYYFTYQRITNSPIKTVVTTLPNTTNFINVAAGRTIQLFFPLGPIGGIEIQPQGSTNSFPVQFSRTQPPSITGPAIIQVPYYTNVNVPRGSALSYYFSDDVVQFPPTGLLSAPAPILEVNIEKSYDLKTWLPSATFHTEAETGAFYRLRMLK